MGSVSSTSSALSNLLQTLSAESPVLSTVLSAPGVQAALAKDPPQDLVQLSDEASQLQEVSLLFGSANGTQFPGSDSSGSSDTPSDLILQAMESSAEAEASVATSSSVGTPVNNSTSLSTQTADAASNSYAQELATLFGTAPTVNPLLSTFG